MFTSYCRWPGGKPDFIPKEEILKELEDIENNLNELEKKGVELEKQLRRSEEGERKRGGGYEGVCTPTLAWALCSPTKVRETKGAHLGLRLGFCCSLKGSSPLCGIEVKDGNRVRDQLGRRRNCDHPACCDLERSPVSARQRYHRSAQTRRSKGAEESSVDELMVDWFNLIRNKQIYMRRESELVYIAKTQDLEEQQPGVEEELRRLMEKPDRLKTPADRKREEELMQKLVEIVNDRNAIVEGLDEDRLREEEEDQQMNQLMQDLGKSV
ncbi:hypothetical protein JZ751_026181 [Albula glossodonta]|uniref:BMERB domain-containing protein n=1 Tax=Albula glossodonta TaxID=121402 RepID=A0A8T2PJY1_9TELE|nr:hypothetical protein JZ751_026181 [Albula glossodonta]